MAAQKLSEPNPIATPKEAGYDSRFSIFQPPALDISTQSELTVDYRPIGTLARGQSIDFLIPNTNIYYTDLSRTYLRLRARIVRNDGSPTVSPSDDAPAKPDPKIDKVAFAQLPLSSCFRQVDIMLNQTLMSSQIGVNAPYKAVLDHLVYKDREFLTSSAQSALFYYDTPGHMNATDVASGGTNKGLLQRYEWSKDGSEIFVQGTLPHDLSELQQYIPSNVEIKIKLLPSTDEFCLMSGQEQEGYKVDITDATLSVRFIEPNNPLILAHASSLETTPAIFNYMRSNIKSFTIPASLMTWSIDQLFANQIPAELLVCMVKSTAYTGRYTENPFNFAHHDLSYLEFSIEGTQRKTFVPDFDKNAFTDEYLALYSDEGGRRRGGIIELLDFKQGYAIYRIKITPGVDRTYTLSQNKAQTRLSFRFKRALPTPVTCIAYGKFYDSFRIDKTRNVYL